ncbi:MAG TPA: hypothetical protein VKB93_14745 [Thermoanaerobaculia bacterium]|nr:hypothetical protein [Thermoanaerobaculia bacterium]
MTAARIAITAAFLFLAAIFAIAQYRDLARPPHLDEVQHLHSGTRIAHGERIYRDFFEHHPPLFAGMLSLLAGDDTVHYVARARLLAGASAAIAILSAALIVYRAAGNLSAPLIFIALLLAAGSLWRNGIGDIRAESPALACWWSGAALVLLARNEWLRGSGMGLVFVAATILPKWPLESLVIAIVFLARPNMRAIAAAIAVALAAIAITASLADLGTAWHYVVTFSRAIWLELTPTDASWTMRCPWLLRPPIVVLAVLFVLWRQRTNKLAILFVVLSLSSLAEMRFLFYPNTDFRFWPMWSFAAAALLALAPQRMRAVIPITLTVLALVLALDHIPPQRSLRESYWRWSQWMNARLGANETVWMGTRWHPIGARDASYWWFGFDDAIPAATKLGEVRESDLPPCKLAGNVRFLGDPGEKLPVVRACFERLRASGAIIETPVPDVWLVSKQKPHAAQ